MRSLFLSLALACALAPTSASAQRLTVVAEVVRGAAATSVRPARAAAAHARIGDRVVLTVRERHGRSTRPLPAHAEVRWLRVAPRLEHRVSPPPNPGNPTYSNAVLMGPRHGRWIGYDRVEYVERELRASPIASLDGQRLILRGAAPPPRARTIPRRARARMAGTIWIAAEVRYPDGRRARTPGLSDRDTVGLSRRVMRVSFRTDDSLLGWLSTYFDVPYVFGSTPGQVERYLGVDCADVMVAARRRERRRPIAYTSVQGIARHARPRSEALTIGGDGVVRDANGAAVTLRFGRDVRPGDLLAIDYTDAAAALPRAWDHIAAVLADSGPGGAPNGVLDGHDLLRHMGVRGLTDGPLRDHGRIRFRIWRFR